MTVVINPTPPSSGSGGATTPTSMQTDLTVANHTQMLYRQHIITGSHSILIGIDASLVST